MLTRNIKYRKLLLTLLQRLNNLYQSGGINGAQDPALRHIHVQQLREMLARFRWYVVVLNIVPIVAE